MPMPDPTAPFRGRPWRTSRERLYERENADRVP